MTAGLLVAELRERGVELRADGDLLRCRPKSALTPEDLTKLRARKLEVLAYLRRELSRKQTGRVVCYACKTSRFWLSIHGVIVCGLCHPPASPDLVDKWIEHGAAEDGSAQQPGQLVRPRRPLRPRKGERG